MKTLIQVHRVSMETVHTGANIATKLMCQNVYWLKKLFKYIIEAYPSNIFFYSAEANIAVMTGVWIITLPINDCKLNCSR